ncbi:LD-carboxypeptidase [Cytobacillus sp. FJAT-54145]|uniref:LD-carboxypeptidase n=1 Tax=Cytobacillus spartinae TaxID=3299023 RepID=A0ABW6KAQ7_9BACI
MMIKPQSLKRGDTIGILAPASPPNQENLERSLEFLRELGLNVKFGQHVKNEYGYLAGTDEERLEDLHNMFLDKEVKGIICAGGGYGTARIAAEIDYDLIKNNPKILWGYSDITFLHMSIYQQTGLVTFHGPMLASDIGKEDAHALSKQYFQQLFEPKTITYTEEFSALQVLVEGEVEAILVGGNLSLITSSLGTPFEIDTKDKLLLIEDINEEPRAVDRMLNQLYMAGKLKEAAGFIIGDFNNCVPEREKSLTLEEVIEHYIQKAAKPAMKGFNIGHCSPNIGVPLGVNVKFSTSKKQVIFESGVDSV